MMIAPITILGETVDSQADTPKRFYPYEMAKAGFWAPFIAFAIGIMTSTGREQLKSVAIAIGVLNVLLVLGGLVLSIIALCAIPKYGRKRLLGYGVAGLIVNGLVVYAMVTVFIKVGNLAEALKPYTTEQLAAMPQRYPGWRVVVDPQRRYRLELPSNYSEVGPANRPPGMAYLFRRPLSDEIAMAISIEHLDGRIDSKALTLAEAKGVFPADAELEIRQHTWRDYKLDTIYCKRYEGALPIEMILAQVPVRAGAVQIIVGGPEGSDEHYNALLGMILDSMVAKSNWDRPKTDKPEADR